MKLKAERIAEESVANLTDADTSSFVAKLNATKLKTIKEFKTNFLFILFKIKI